MAGLLGTITGQVRLDIRQAVAAYAALRADNAKTVYALRGTGDAFVAAGRKMTMAGAGLLYIFGKAVTAAAEFEKKMDYFGAVTSANQKQISRLSDDILKMANTSIYSASEIADGVVELGKAGVGTKDIIDGIGQAMVNLGAAGDISLTESGQMITTTIQQYGMAAKDAVHVTDMLAGAANASIADISDLGYSLKYVGGVADAVGISFDDTITALSLLAKAGIRGSTAGTSLRQMLVSLGGATGPATDELKKLGIITGKNNNLFFDQNGKAKSLGRIFQILQKHTENLSRKEKLAALRTIFNNRALASAAILTRDGAKGFRQMYKAMGKVSAADVAHKRLDNLAGDIKILKSNIDTFMIKAGTPFQNVLRGWVQHLTALVKAFGNLDPHTQKMIIQFVGISGAALVAMGTFAMIIGTVLKFIVAMKNLVAGVKFVAGALGLIETGGEAAGAGLLGAIPVVGWIILALIALAAACVWAYKHIQVFHDWVNKIGKSFMNDFVHPLINGGKAVISWFGSLPGKFSSIWNTVSSTVSGFVGKVVGFFTSLPGKIGHALSGAASSVGGFIGRVASGFAKLPGKVIGIVTAFVGKVVSLFTFHNIGYAIGFMIGTVIRLWWNFQKKLYSIAAAVVRGVVNFFKALPGRIANFVVTMVTRAVALFNRLRAQAISIAASLVTRFIGFIKALPGRVAAFVAAMTARALSLIRKLESGAIALAARVVSGMVRFFAELPGRIGNFFSSMVSRARALLGNMVGMAVNMGHNVYNGIVNGIRALPGAVSGIIGSLISAFKAKIASAAAAVRDFAAGLWQGFKDGIGMNSPSYFERAIWQITDTVDQGVKDLSKHTLRIQKMSKRMAKTQFTVGGTSPKALSRVMADRKNADRRARELAGVGARRSGKGSPAPTTHRKQSLVEGELRLHPSGRAFIRGVAQETYDDNSSYNDSLDGMG